MVFPILIIWMSSLSFLRTSGVMFHFSMKIKIANRIAPDGTPRFAASHLGLFCLPMSHKKDASLIWVDVSVPSVCADYYIKYRYGSCVATY